MRRRFNPWVGKMPWRRACKPLPYSCLENPMDRGAWRATVHRVTKNGTQWKESTGVSAQQQCVCTMVALMDHVCPGQGKVPGSSWPIRVLSVVMWNPNKEGQEGNLSYGGTDNLWIWKLWVTLIAPTICSEQLRKPVFRENYRDSPWATEKRSKKEKQRSPSSLELPSSHVFSFLAPFPVVHTWDWVSWITPASWDELQLKLDSAGSVAC